MTLKELADIAGVSPETVRRTAKSLFPDKFKNGVRTIFDEQQSLEIMREVSKKNMVSLQQRDLATQPVKVPTQPVEVMEMFRMMMEQNQKFMAAVLGEIKNISSPGLVAIEPPKQDYYSLVAYCSIHKIKTSTSELKKMGMDLRKMTKSADKELHKVEDERWGFVNSYPIEVLDEYFRL